MSLIKIVTYSTHSSIGSILQSFALQKSLLKNGYNNELLLPKNDSKNGKSSIKRKIRNVLEIPFKKNINLAKKKRNDFISEHISAVRYTDYTDLKHIISHDNAKCYLAGSDQIWHPAVCNPVFFLDFANDKKRISYAASMGDTTIPTDKKEIFARYINNFDRISVREKECADVIGEFTNKKIEVNIDPTFLISLNEWKLYEKKYEVNEPYILLYMIYWDESLVKKIKILKKQTGLKVYTIKNGFSKAYGDKMLYDVGVGEFLWLIDHAEYIITSSFHGVAMATIFNKKFSAVINPKSPSRIENLMRVLDVPYVDIEKLNVSNFNYSDINQRIITEREKGLNYLREAIG